MRSNRKRTNWTARTELESEESNKYMDTFALSLKDKRKDLLLFQELKEEVARLKSLSLEQQENIDCMRREIVCMNEEIVKYKSQSEYSRKLKNMFDAVIDNMIIGKDIVSPHIWKPGEGPKPAPV